MNTTFQSYLIIGDQIIRRGETQDLAKSFGINLLKASPDIFIIEPQGQFVTIDQVRNLKRHIFQKPLKSNFKFVVIEEANKLTDEAQNALLKILEEPPASAIIVLEADNKQQFLPTILSRVITKKSQQPKLLTSSDFNILERDSLAALEKIAQVENPNIWLSSQIQMTYQKLLKKIRGGNSNFTLEDLAWIIEKCAKAKAMIEANVNAKFVLANLLFQINSITESQ